MNVFKFLSVLFCLLLFACGGDSNSISGDDNFFTCKVEGEDFERRGIYAYVTDFSIDAEFVVYGATNPDEVGKEATIYIAFPQSTTEGSYSLNGDDIYAYVVDYNGLSYWTSVDNPVGTLNITDISDTRYEGTFSFEVVDFADDTNILNVTEGSFSVLLR